MLRKYLGVAGVAVPVIVLDQATKFWIEAFLQGHRHIEVIPRFLNIVHVRNPGVAFGLLQDIPGTFRSALLIAATVLALALLVYLLVQTHPRQRLERWCLALVLGGAAGNLIDRFRLGEVVDFIDAHWMDLYHWPAFNVADACISTGVACLVLLEIRRIITARISRQRHSAS